MVRRRVLEVLKRNTGRPYSQHLINEGNELVQSGDAIADAALYKDEARTDSHIYLELYGLDPLRVLEFRMYIYIQSNSFAQDLRNLRRPLQTRCH